MASVKREERRKVCAAYKKNVNISYKSYVKAKHKKITSLGSSDPRQYWQLINNIHSFSFDNSSMQVHENNVSRRMTEHYKNEVRPIGTKCAQ